MSDAQIAAIRDSLTQIKVCVARLDERADARDALIKSRHERMDKMELKLERLDLKVAAAMGGVALISYCLYRQQYNFPQ